MITRVNRVIRGGDEGITLTELLVAMALTALALAMIGGFFSSIMRSIAVGKATRTATSVAVNATNEMSRIIRTASTNAVLSGTPTPAVVDGTATTLTVISYVDTNPTSPAPTKVSFAVNSSGNLIETRVAAQQSSGLWVFTGATTTRTVSGPISASAQIFTYNDSSGTPIVPASTGLTAAQASSVASVTVTVTAANGTDNPVVITTTAAMTNLTLS